MRREYESGMKWCLWRWKDIYWKGNLYLRRLHVFQCPLFAIMVHFIKDHDRQRHMHDHPVSMLSIFLSGGYGEVRQNGCLRITSWKGAIYGRRFNWIPAHALHRIISITEPVITLVICGPREREWGFHTENGWIPWREYHKLYGGETS